MDKQDVEHEICGNCKKEIPQFNYVMHTAHCARNITLCQVCKEPIPKNQFEDHKKRCMPKAKTVVAPIKKKTPEPPRTNIEKSSYYQTRKEAEDHKIATRKEKYLERHEKFLDAGHSMKRSDKTPSPNKQPAARSPSPRDVKPKTNNVKQQSVYPTTRATNGAGSDVDLNESFSQFMVACPYCDLELSKLDSDEHESYCGSRTDKCLQCGELVMFKYKQIHMDTDHGFLKLKDEPGPKASWDSSTQRNALQESPRRPRPAPFRPFTDFNAYDPVDYIPPSYGAGPNHAIKKKEGESYKEISRRVDCKTEYIRNLLHDSASITVPLRHNGAIPRNHFNHNKGPAPKPPRSRNPPTELVIPCEFCDTPIPHEDLIQHETGCRPDLTRVRRRSPEPDDYFVAPEPNSPEVEIPCEFCADMIPASQLYRHQAACN